MEHARSDTRLCLRSSAAVGLVSAGALSLFSGADVSSLDAGELGGAGFALGVPHPSGFSLDMLLLRASSSWPLGTLAFRQNLCVSLIASAAVGCVAYACTRLARQCGWSSAPAAAAAASVSAAVLLSSRTILDAALSVEVYMSSLLCVVLAGLLADATSPARRRAVGPLAGLALGAHITAPLLIVPSAWVALTRGSGSPRRGLWLSALACACCAMVLLYLPLASLRDTAFDWGDPETLGRWFRHLSAARIREAYADALFTRDGMPRVHLIEQLSEHTHWLSFALIGVIGVARLHRQRALVLGAVLSLDLAYASWVNPMGVAQRQVGHASIAVIALFAGCGCALLVERLRALRAYAGQVAAAATACACAWAALVALSQTSASDGYAVSERYGAASPLSELAPRAVYVCESDSACASALFAVYAEGTRPELDVVPAQHLWDPTVLRRLRGMPLSAATGASEWPQPNERASWATRRQAALFGQSDTRPVYVERLMELDADKVGLSSLPFVRVHAHEEPASLASLEQARFGAAGPLTPLARDLWASAHEALGTVWLRRGQMPLAVSELARTVALTPLRAAARSNLGVALERSGELAAALQETAHALDLDPQRATPWVNLTRLLLRVRGPEAAREALDNAERHAVRDARLDVLRRDLQQLSDAQGTTRK